jgi:hypothetical protein
VDDENDKSLPWTVDFIDAILLAKDEVVVKDGQEGGGEKQLKPPCIT